MQVSPAQLCQLVQADTLPDVYKERLTRFFTSAPSADLDGVSVLAVYGRYKRALYSFYDSALLDLTDYSAA